MRVAHYPRRAGHHVGALVAAVFLVLLAGVLPAARAEAITFDSGHVDAFYVTANGGELDLALKEDVTGSGVVRAPQEVTLQVNEQAWTDATESVDGIGASTYLLPQTQDPNLLWPGWDTQAVRSGGFGQVDLNFDEVTGPGAVYAFESTGFGDLGGVTTDGGLELASGSVISQQTPAHRHVNWAFSEPGTYTMTVRATADGAESSPQTYTWVVGESGGEHQDAGAGEAAPESGGSAQDGQDDASSEPGARGGAPAAAADKGQPGRCTPGIQPQVKDDSTTPASWVPADDAVFHLSDAARTDLPEDIGPVGRGPAWMIGSTQQPGVPWLGANTQHPTMLEHLDGPVTWELTEFSGPGAMMVYSQGQLGQIVGKEWFRAEGNTPSGATTLDPNTHVHPNWLFSEPGTYRVTISQSARLTNGKDVSGQATLTFVVGGQAPAGAFTEGHFDLGGQVNPDGEACAAGATSSGTQPAAGAATGQGTATGQGAATGSSTAAGGALANTGASLMNTAIAVLGIGLAVLGIGMARWALVEGRR